MNRVTKSEYLNLLKGLSDGSNNNRLEDAVDGCAWFPSESPAKERMLKIRERDLLEAANRNSIIDLTDAKRIAIREAVGKYTMLKIHEFSIKVRKYQSSPNNQVTMDLEFFEHVTKTPGGFPCNMEKPKNILKDGRFNDQEWLKYFTISGSNAYNVPFNEVIEMIKWIQAIKKYIHYL